MRKVEFSFSVFQDIELYISKNPSALVNAQRGGGEQEMYEALLLQPKDQMCLESENRFSANVDQHIERTYRQYPFVPHWAFSLCVRTLMLSCLGQTGQATDDLLGQIGLYARGQFLILMIQCFSFLIPALQTYCRLR